MHGACRRQQFLQHLGNKKQQALQRNQPQPMVQNPPPPPPPPVATVHLAPLATGDFYANAS